MQQLSFLGTTLLMAWKADKPTHEGNINIIELTHIIPLVLPRSNHFYYHKMEQIGHKPGQKKISYHPIMHMNYILLALQMAMLYSFSAPQTS